MAKIIQIAPAQPGAVVVFRKGDEWPVYAYALTDEGEVCPVIDDILGGDTKLVALDRDVVMNADEYEIERRS